MYNLNDKIIRTLADPETEPWFPNLTDLLVSRAKIMALEPIGLSLSSYGTERFLKCDPRAQRKRILDIKTTAARYVTVEQLSTNIRKAYEGLGLNFLRRTEVNTNLLATLKQAFSRLEQLPSLYASTTSLVRTVHLLDAGDEAYDISHSDPLVPFSIFLSVPKCDSPDAAPRVMESIVHEAMHLQLTLIEYHMNLISQPHHPLRSPWRDEKRPPQGVLHGTYVFTVIARAYSRLLSLGILPKNERKFVSDRYEKITSELRIAHRSLNPEVLTPNGQVFHTLLYGTNFDLSDI